MSLTNSMTYIRLILTAAVTGLTALYSYYPHDVWILPIVTAIASVGIHAVPSITQTNPPEQQASPTEHTG